MIANNPRLWLSQPGNNSGGTNKNNKQKIGKSSGQLN
jgi:hypothetical protein